jgi:hypothetical protein
MVEQHFHFAFFDKGLCLFYRYAFPDYKITSANTAQAGGCANYCGCLQCLTSEERWHILQKDVSIGVPSRREPGRIFALKCPKWMSN